MPARPVLLGGDDIAIIVRADLAVSFTEVLLRQIVETTQAALGGYPSLDLPKCLSACAGIVIVREGHPFLAADRLAQGMCKHAKSIAKTSSASDVPVSAMSFAVVTSTLDEDYKSWRERELKIGRSAYASAAPYVVWENAGAHGLPSFEAVVALARALEGIEGRGKLVEATGLWRTDPARAEKRFVRFLEVTKAKDGEGMERLTAALNGLGVSVSISEPQLEAALPFLNDALELIDIGAIAAHRRLAQRCASSVGSAS